MKSILFLIFIIISFSAISSRHLRPSDIFKRSRRHPRPANGFKNGSPIFTPCGGPVTYGNSHAQASGNFKKSDLKKA